MYGTMKIKKRCILSKISKNSKTKDCKNWMVFFCFFVLRKEGGSEIRKLINRKTKKKQIKRELKKLKFKKSLRCNSLKI